MYVYFSKTYFISPVANGSTNAPMNLWRSVTPTRLSTTAPECHMWSSIAAFSVYAVGHAAAFTVNAALVASQWQHLSFALTHRTRARSWTAGKYRFSRLTCDSTGIRTQPTGSVV